MTDARQELHPVGRCGGELDLPGTADGSETGAADRPFDIDGAAVGVELAGIVQRAGDEQRR
jgi:hypothetical protein